MAALSGADLIPSLRRLGTDAFQVVATCTAKPSRLHGPGSKHQPSSSSLLRRCLAHGDTSMRTRWLQCCNRLSASVIRNCPQRFSVSSVLRTLGLGLPRMSHCPTTVVALVSKQRCSPRAGSKLLLLVTGHADTASPKQGTSSINYEALPDSHDAATK